MKDAFFWDIKTHFKTHRKHVTSPLQSPAGYCSVRSEVFTAVTMKNIVFWNMKTQFVPHKRYITSPLQSPAGIHSDDYEEWRLLGYKYPVRTSQEIY
jgi:hypothetical protein